MGKDYQAVVPDLIPESGWYRWSFQKYVKYFRRFFFPWQLVNFSYFLKYSADILLPIVFIVRLNPLSVFVTEKNSMICRGTYLTSNWVRTFETETHL